MTIYMNRIKMSKYDPNTIEQSITRNRIKALREYATILYSRVKHPIILKKYGKTSQ